MIELKIKINFVEAKAMQSMFRYEVVKESMGVTIWRDGERIGYVVPLLDRFRGRHGLEAEDRGGIFWTEEDAVTHVVAKELWFDAQWEARLAPVEVAA